MRGFIVNNAYSRLNTALNQSQRLKYEFEKLGVETDVVTSAGIISSIDDKGIPSVGKYSEKYDFCVYLDKDKYASRLLEKCGIRLFNTAEAIETCDDKMLTHIILSEHGVNMPFTVPGLLCYTPETPLNLSYLNRVEHAIGQYPIIIKECYGSLGKQVYKADNREQLLKIANCVKCKPHLFQKCVNSTIGRDVRVIAVGGNPVAAMMRKSETDFRSNIELGGTAEIYEINGEIVQLCKTVEKTLKLDYFGIDLLFAPEGFSVCEINSNAFFGGIEKVTGVNVAKAYAQHICESIKIE